jgi:hypothetical protein
MCRDPTSRGVRPDPHLEPPTPRTTASRVRRALQHAPPAPQPRATRTQRTRSCRVSARPAAPTTSHLQRTRQPVPPNSLNPLTTANPTPATPTSARPLPHNATHNTPPTLFTEHRKRIRHAQGGLNMIVRETHFYRLAEVFFDEEPASPSSSTSSGRIRYLAYVPKTSTRSTSTSRRIRSHCCPSSLRPVNIRSAAPNATNSNTKHGCRPAATSSTTSSHSSTCSPEARGSRPPRRTVCTHWRGPVFWISLHDVPR